jgi:hypothetical protein
MWTGHHLLRSGWVLTTGVKATVMMTSHLPSILSRLINYLTFSLRNTRHCMPLQLPHPLSRSQPAQHLLVLPMSQALLLYLLHFFYH